MKRLVIVLVVVVMGLSAWTIPSYAQQRRLSKEGLIVAQERIQKEINSLMTLKTIIET